MDSWGDFERSEPEFAAFGLARLDGEVAYFATTRRDGRPRVHPVTPIIGQGHLFLFMEPTSPKGKDLQRGSAYSLHCAVSDNTGAGGEFQVSGHGQLIEAPDMRQLAVELAKYEPEGHYILFELSVERVFSTVYTEADIERKRWRASSWAP